MRQRTKVAEWWERRQVLRDGARVDITTFKDEASARRAKKRGTLHHVTRYRLAPLVRLIDAHALAAARLHGDDTTVPVLAKGKTNSGRLWVYVRDDRPFGGPASPAAIFHYAPDRTAPHPNLHLALSRGILQADAYARYNDLYATSRKPGPITEAGCWAHARRKFFELAELTKAPVAVEAVRQIDAIFAKNKAVANRTIVWLWQTVGAEIRAIGCRAYAGMGLPAIIADLRGLGYVWGKHYAPHDGKVRELGSGKSREEIASALGMTWTIVAQIGLQSGIDATRAMLGRVWFDAEACKDGIEALRLYRTEYDDERRVFSTAPLHDWTSHYADAMRYLAVVSKEQATKRRHDAGAINWMS
jgi:hypothetical protein